MNKTFEDLIIPFLREKLILPSKIIKKESAKKKHLDEIVSKTFIKNYFNNK